MLTLLENLWCKSPLKNRFIDSFKPSQFYFRDSEEVTGTGGNQKKPSSSILTDIWDEFQDKPLNDKGNEEEDSDEVERERNDWFKIDEYRILHNKIPNMKRKEYSDEDFIRLRPFHGPPPPPPPHPYLTRRHSPRLIFRQQPHWNVFCIEF